MKLKYIVKIFVITYLFFGISNSLAENKIVYVDMNRILTESKVGIFVEKHLTDIHKGNLDKFKKSEEDLKKDEIELISKRNIMNAQEFGEKLEALREKAAEYQKQRREKFDSINEKRNKATAEVMKELEPILANYAEQNQIAFIIEQKSIVVGKNDFDATKDIIEELDKKLPSIKIN